MAAARNTACQEERMAPVGNCRDACPRGVRVSTLSLFFDVSMRRGASDFECVTTSAKWYCRQKTRVIQIHRKVS